jgi:hypothetical protein
LPACSNSNDISDLPYSPVGQDLTARRSRTTSLRLESRIDPIIANTEVPRELLAIPKLIDAGTYSGPTTASTRVGRIVCILRHGASTDAIGRTIRCKYMSLYAYVNIDRKTEWYCQVAGGN